MQKISILHTFKIYLTKKYIIFGVQFPFKVKEKETKLTGFLLMQNIIVLYTELFCKWKGSKFLHPRDNKIQQNIFLSDETNEICKFTKFRHFAYLYMVRYGVQ